jgi:effector-binding domain-containing protein
LNYEITLDTVKEQPVAAARQRTTFKKVAREIGELLAQPWAFIKEHRDLRTNGDNVAIYRDESAEGSIEVGVQVSRAFEGNAEVVCSSTPAGAVARTAHFGPYDQLRSAHEAVREWCKQNGREIALPFWEVYGDWNDDPSKLRTDVFYLLK